MSGVETLQVAPDEAGLRLDRWFQKRFPDVPHGHLQKWLRTGQVRVDGRRAKAGLRLEAGQGVRIPPHGGEERRVPPSSKPQPKPAEGRAPAIPVLYRDESVLVVAKPAGLAVQGGSRLDQHLDALLDGLRFEAAERPRLVHRLDKDTSGVLVLARTAAAAAHLARAFRSRETRKLYWALVVGVPKPAEGIIDAPIAKRGGPGAQRMRTSEEADAKGAVTAYRMVDHAGRRAAWLALEPLTGRTHQLRVHCALLGTPILGDGKYGGSAAFLPDGEGRRRPQRLHLHARSILIPGPSGRLIEATAPLPPHMAATWRFLGLDPGHPEAGFGGDF